MKAFFKDNNKIIINSMDYTEALIGKAFMEKAANSDIVIEQRYDINDDFDGFVITLKDKVVSEEPKEDTSIEEPAAPEDNTAEPTKDSTETK